MRAFINAILSFIGASSLTNDEFGTFTITSQTYTAALYEEIKAVLVAREGVSSTGLKLKGFFVGKGVFNISTDPGTTPSDADATPRSNIYIGDPL